MIKISESTGIDMNGASITDASSVEGVDINQGSSELFDKSNILGIVSQAAGVPTGAIIERGSNANGEFVKYADGTLVCYRRIIKSIAMTSASGSMFLGATTEDTSFPVAFAFAPEVKGFVNDGSGGSAGSFFYKTASTTTTSFGTAYFMSTTSKTSTLTYSYVAVGKWH